MRGMLKPLAILPCLVIAAMGALASHIPAAETSEVSSPLQTTPAAVIVLHGQINAYSQGTFVRHVNLARQLGAKVIIIDLDTYGGVVTSALELSHFIKQQVDLRVIAYVNSKAYSAGAMIALACNEIVMAPVAALGDCAPIAIGLAGLQPLPPTERAKQESPILADFQDSALRNGYDPLLVQSMVAINRVVHWVQKDGQRRFVDGTQLSKLAAEGWKTVEDLPDPINSADSLLTVSTDGAIRLGLARQSAADLTQLLHDLNLNLIGTFRPSAGDQIIAFLGSSPVRLVFLVIFLTTLYIALHAPGHGLAEAVAVLALAVLLGVPLLTGFAQWWEIVAILLGIGLLALELFVIPGFGAAGLIGITLILSGLILTFVAPEPGRSPLSLPRLPMTWTSLQNGLAVVVGGLVASLLLCWWLRHYLPRLPYFNRLILTTTVGSESGMVGSLTNIDPSELAPAVGVTGTAMTDLCPGGSAQFRDAAGGTHVVSVVCDSGFVTRGTPLVVREVAGNRIVVRPADPRKP